MASRVANIVVVSTPLRTVSVAVMVVSVMILAPVPRSGRPRYREHCADRARRPSGNVTHLDPAVAHTGAGPLPGRHAVGSRGSPTAASSTSSGRAHRRDPPTPGTTVRSAVGIRAASVAPQIGRVARVVGAEEHGDGHVQRVEIEAP